MRLRNIGSDEHVGLPDRFRSRARGVGGLRRLELCALLYILPSVRTLGSDRCIKINMLVVVILPSLATKSRRPPLTAAILQALLVEERDPRLHVKDNLSREKFST